MGLVLGIARHTSGVTIEERLLRAMERRGYNQRTLAEALGVHAKTVSGWVNGRYSPKGYRQRLRDLLGEDVMDGDGETTGRSQPAAQLSDGEIVAQMQIYLAELGRRIATGETQSVPPPTDKSHPGVKYGRWDLGDTPGSAQER